MKNRLRLLRAYLTLALALFGGLLWLLLASLFNSE